jgi:fructosamine-3-kinase
MIELTPLQEQVGILAIAGSVLFGAGLIADDYLARRRQHNGWARAANQLVAKQRVLRDKVEQLESHVAHQAAELERLRGQVAARPPSDPTVRLGITPGRTARLGRLDPTWPPLNGRH